MTTETKYNGYTNYETWAVALWIDSEECTQTYWAEAVREAWIQATETAPFTKLETATFALASQLMDAIEEGNPLTNTPGLYSDLLRTALYDVNYNEIARNWLEEVST